MQSNFRPVSSIKLRGVHIGLLLIALCSASSVANDDPAVAIPPALAAWIPWVLHDADDRACPLATDAASRLCTWSDTLQLWLDHAGGRFAQTWQIYSAPPAQRWITLPGDATHWPQQVRVDDQPAVVLQRAGVPMVQLPAGRHQLTGQFYWSQLPDGLQLPLATARLELWRGDQRVTAPVVTPDQRLWLDGTAAAAPATEPQTTALTVTRRIDDGIPVTVTTRLTLDTAGAARELLLPRVLLGDGVAIQLDSPLPAQLESDGRLRLQIRPGHWVIQVISRHAGPVPVLTRPPLVDPWPPTEVWVLQPAAQLRQVTLHGDGVARVDPRQTPLPEEWHALPASVVQPVSQPTLAVLPQTPAPPDQLQLAREVWLDFDGRGWSSRDQIDGRVTTATRLTVSPALTLGQVRVNDTPQFITRVADREWAGVELRSGAVHIVADARVPTRQPLPASGWNLPFNQITTRVHLPPGWDVLATAGTDNLPDSWLARWSLLDLFLVLIASSASIRLWGWRWGALASVTFILTWQSPAAPQWWWLQLLAALALQRALPTSAPLLSGLRRVIRGYYWLVMVGLVTTALPFVTAQVRSALYPHLAFSAAHAQPPAAGAPAAVMASDELAVQEMDAMPAAPVASLRSSRPLRKSMNYAASPAPALATLDPTAQVPTGAGVPEWTWRQFTFSWQGAVTAAQTVQLWLLPPAAGVVIALLQLLGIAALLGKSVAWSQLPWWRRPLPAPAVALLLVGMSALLTLAVTPPALADESPPDSAASAYPSTALLEQLRTRLLAPPDCQPQCVALPQLHVHVSATAVQLELTFNAAVTSAVPLPGAAAQWQTATLLLDEQPLTALQRAENGELLLVLPAGEHRVSLTAPLPPTPQPVELPLPLLPQQITTDLAPGWQLDGVDQHGRPAGAQLRLLPPIASTSSADAPAAPHPTNGLAALVRVERQLDLGVEWTVTTQVTRLSAAAAAVSVWLPLLPDEAVTTAGYQVESHAGTARLLVTLPPGEMTRQWTSRLTPRSQLHLTASTDERVTDVWCVAVSPLWHVAISGVAAQSGTCAADHALGWRLWPDERVELTLTRPQAVPGATVTVDRSVYTVTPSQRTTTAQLALTVRSSQGGTFAVQLPAAATSIALRVNEQPQGVRLTTTPTTANQIDISLVPGVQRIELRWQQPTGIHWRYQPPAVTLPIASVNAHTTIALAPNRWIIWLHGAGIGPALLLWGILPVIVLFAWALGRSHYTPLTAWDWFWLSMGIVTQGQFVTLLLFAGWLAALQLRQRLRNDTPRWRFNTIQFGLVLLTGVALLGLISSVNSGLLAAPAAYISGNESSATQLRWYVDRADPTLGQAGVISTPLWIYRAVMLLWAMWLALRLLNWLRWSWRCFATPIPWRGRQLTVELE